MPTIDLTHLQALAAAGEVANDPGILAQIEALVGQVLQGGASVTLNRYDFYPTPDDVISRALDSLAEVDYTPETILEPSCGTGAWLTEVNLRWPNARVDVVERNPLNRVVLRGNPRVNLVGDDFLAYDPSAGYDLIIGNPPFGDDTNKLAWVRHLEHAMEMLTARGQMIMIAPAGIAFRNDKPIQRLREHFRIMDLPPGSFKDSGTGANVSLAWYSPDQSLEPKFQTPKGPPEPDAPKLVHLDPKKIARDLGRSLSYADQLIDRLTAPPRQLPLTDQTDDFQGWRNFATWYANTIVTQNRVANETIRLLLPTFKGSNLTRSVRLREYWRDFCRSTRIEQEMRLALKEIEATLDDIDWEALVDEWDRA